MITIRNCFHLSQLINIWLCFIILLINSRKLSNVNEKISMEHSDAIDIFSIIHKFLTMLPAKLAFYAYFPDNFTCKTSGRINESLRESSNSRFHLAANFHSLNLHEFSSVNGSFRSFVKRIMSTVAYF